MSERKDGPEFKDRYIIYESLWLSLRYELFYIKEFNLVRELKLALRDWFESYNKEKVHQSLGYKTPDEVYYSLRAA